MSAAGGRVESGWKELRVETPGPRARPCQASLPEQFVERLGSSEFDLGSKGLARFLDSESGLKGLELCVPLKTRAFSPLVRSHRRFFFRSDPLGPSQPGAWYCPNVCLSCLGE